MGQINLSRITTTSSIITPPDGCDAMYNQNGVFYFLNSSGATYSFLQTPIDGVGRTNYLPLWTDNDSLSISSLYQTGTTLYSNTLSGATNSMIMSDTNGKLYNSNIRIRQIAVTVSGVEILSLYSSPKTLVPKDGGASTRVHQVISAYVKVIPSTGNYSSNTTLAIYEGGNGYTHTCNALGSTQIRRYRFIPVDTSTSLVQTQDDDNAITLSTLVGNPSGGTGSAVVYLTYTTYDEANISYQP